MNASASLRTSWIAAVLTLLACAAAPAYGGDLYLRLGAGLEESGDTTVLDIDCESTSPPALFGCVDDDEGKPLAARGDFGSGTSWELAAGIEVGSRTRFELALTERSFLDLDAEANFVGVTGEQPVDSNGRSRAALVGMTFDLGDTSRKIRPFVGVAAGAARNETGDVTFGFPGIAPGAVTVVQGGSHTDFAWSATVGLSFRVGDATFVDLALRHTDLGDLRTDDGPATIVRPSRTFELDIAGTEAGLETTGLFVSVRRRIGRFGRGAP